MNPEETTTTEEVTPENQVDPTAMNNIVTLDETQYQTLVGISERTDLLTNRVEVLVIFNIIILCLFIYALMRSKT